MNRKTQNLVMIQAFKVDFKSLYRNLTCLRGDTQNEFLQKFPGIKIVFLNQRISRYKNIVFLKKTTTTTKNSFCLYHTTNMYSILYCLLVCVVSLFVHVLSLNPFAVSF